MIEAVPEIQEVAPQSEIELLEKRLVIQVTARVNLGQEIMLRAIQQERRPELLLYSVADKGRETLLAIRPRDKDRAYGDLCSRSFGVDTVRYKRHSTVPEKEDHWSVDFSGAQPSVSLFGRRERTDILKHREQYSYKKNLQETLQMLEGVPVSEILNPEHLGELGIYIGELHDLLKINETHGIDRQHKVLERAKNTLEWIGGERPVLAEHAINYLLARTREQIGEGDIGKILELPIMEALTDKNVWKNEKIAGQVSRFLAQKLVETDLEGEPLMSHSIMQFLQERLKSDDFITLCADLGLLEKWPASLNETLGAFLKRIRDKKQDLAFSIAGQVIKRLEDKKGEALVSDPNWELLEKALGSDIFLLSSDLLGRLPPEMLFEMGIEEFGKAKEQVGALKERTSQRWRNALIGASICVGTGIPFLSSDTKIGEILLIQDMSEGFKDILGMLSAGSGIPSFYWLFSVSKLERRLDEAREWALTLQAKIKELHPTKQPEENLNNDQT